MGPDSGCRLTELLNLSWADFTPDYEMMHLWITKAKLSRSIPLTDRSKKALKRLHEVHGQTTNGPFRMFKPNGTLRRVLGKAFDTLGWDHVSIHTFRHTCASKLAMKVAIQKVQKWLGHKNIKTTMRYSRLSMDALNDCHA